MTEVERAIEDVSSAIADGESTVKVGGQEVPATAGTLLSLRKLEKVLSQRDGGSAKEEAEKEEILVLHIHKNFEDNGFARVAKVVRPGALGLPFALKTVPKAHQETGVRWLQSHWQQGSTGCLLADDMGLGKTYQALAFLAWLKEQMDEGQIPRSPLLVVAPVGLLSNWEAEHDEHLAGDGIGRPLRAYGAHLKFLKRGAHASGDAALDTLELSRAPWVLANYEAVSEYQLSFGAVNFGAVVFDEAQKIKSPKARMTDAAKALKSEFVIAMTGTPVENRLADLWCIADTCQPLGLGGLRSFSQNYEGAQSAERLRRLRDTIWQEEGQVAKGEPLLMLRRLKSEKLEGLPVKHEHVIEVDMPPRQQQAYEQALALHDIRGPQGTLGLIQSLRSISLHPGLFDGAGFDPNDSARFIGLMEVLDQINRRKEKALVFVEALDLQAANQLPLLLERRYGLADMPMVINGEVDTVERQKRVRAFQERGTGFDVMILSPKAGGVGLTLTAANHVIHLSRWWNPAVEDQCSDRVYRIGQERDVHIWYPLALYGSARDESFDRKINELLSRKRNVSRTILAPSLLNQEDYDELVRDIGVKAKH